MEATRRVCAERAAEPLASIRSHPSTLLLRSAPPTSDDISCVRNVADAGGEAPVPFSLLLQPTQPFSGLYARLF